MSETGQRIAWAASAACLLEASSDKPGNVTPTRAFGDMTYMDFVLSSLVVGPVMGEAADLPVGELILRAVQATRQVTAANTNLGIVLLLAPLARAWALCLTGASGLSQPVAPAVSLTRAPSVTATPGLPLPLDAAELRAAVQGVVNGLTVADARAAFAAIRLAKPGGLGRAEQHDVRDEPTVTLLQAMVGAADRDMVAAQYATGYELVFSAGLPAFLEAIGEGGAPLQDAVVQTFLRLLAAAPDTLIARKLGAAAAEAVSALAAQALAAGGVVTPAGRAAIARIDDHLRDPDNRRNPGTTADLTAAVLFVALLLHGPDLLGRRAGGGRVANPGL